MHGRWWGIGLILLGGLLLLAFVPALRDAMERNISALQIKQVVSGIEWTDATQICRSLAPPPVLTTRACSALGDCYLAGVLALRRGEWDNVRTSFPADPDPLEVFLLGWSHFCDGTFDSAIATWSFAAAPIQLKFLAAAEASLAGGEADAAMRQGTLAHALKPSSESFLVLAGAQDALEQEPAALKTYYRAIEQNMANARTYGQVGELEWRLGINQSARTHLAEAVRLDPRAWHYWQVYGSLLFRLQDWSASETAFVHAAELAPDFGAAHGGVALTQLRLGKLEQGRDAVKATMTFTPDVRAQAGYLGEFAKLAADAGDLKWSAELYTRALGRTPTNKEWWNALVATYAGMGDCAKMESVYRAYVDLMNGQQKKPAPRPACPA